MIEEAEAAEDYNLAEQLHETLEALEGGDVKPYYQVNRVKLTTTTHAPPIRPHKTTTLRHSSIARH